MTKDEIVADLKDYIANPRKHGQFSWPLDIDYDAHMAFLRFRKKYPDENAVECAKRYLNHMETKEEQMNIIEIDGVKYVKAEDFSVIKGLYEEKVVECEVLNDELREIKHEIQKLWEKI